MKSFDPQTFKFKGAGSYDALTERFDYFTERLTALSGKRMLSLAEPDKMPKFSI